jgi:hypothetical protein
MRFLLPIPLMLLPIALFNGLALAGQWLDAESLYFDGVLPSGTEFYLKLGELLMALGLLMLCLDMLKARRITFLAAGLSVAVFIGALAEFLFVPFAGTTIFFFLMLMALAEALAFVVLGMVRGA